MNYAGLPDSRRYVAYMDLAALNTKKDSHALARNELAGATNLWYDTGNAISKRPGNAAFITSTGATGSGLSGKGMCAGRFANKTTLLVQSGTVVYGAAVDATAFANIGTVSAAAGTTIRSAQLEDPTTPNGNDGLLFVVDGTDAPQTWKGPGSSFAACTAGSLPKNKAGTADITPAFVSTLFSHLFYAGEPTEATAVYISDAFKPQSFSQNAIFATPSSLNVGGTYIPYLVGRNDGINGGKITGLEPLGATMMVYKEAAIYAMVQFSLFGDSIWQVQLVSASVGCTAPRSLVKFDTFHCFLGIDGVYQTDGTTTRRISDNVPTFFDGSLRGTPATIYNRQNAVGVRHGQRYWLFFDALGNGYASSAMFFDFARLDNDGFPATSIVAGMQCGGAVALRGPADDGNFAWCDAVLDRVGKFGIGFADFGASYLTSFSLKADFFSDEFGPAAPAQLKTVNDMTLLVGLANRTANESLTFTASVITDLLAATVGSTPPALTATFPPSGTWGANWGTLVWGAVAATSVFGLSKQFYNEPAIGHIIQFTFMEQSIYDWTVLGVIVYVNAQQVAL